MNEDIKNIAVIGLGLIGSSILHALKLNFKECSKQSTKVFNAKVKERFQIN